MRLSEELVVNESILLNTLGFHVSVLLPHTYVVKSAHLVKVNKDLAKTAYFLATNSLHLTQFCVLYKPTVVACVCFYIACMWANYTIPDVDDTSDIDNITDSNHISDVNDTPDVVGDECQVRSGTYHEDISITNLKGSLTSPIVLRGYADERPKLDGTVPATLVNEGAGSKWTKWKDGIYRAQITEDIWQLFVDCDGDGLKMMINARWPNAQWEDKSIFNASC